MPRLWDRKVTFVLVSQFWGVSLVLPHSICLWTLHNSMSYDITWGRKKKRESEKEK